MPQNFKHMKLLIYSRCQQTAAHRLNQAHDLFLYNLYAENGFYISKGL